MARTSEVGATPAPLCFGSSVQNVETLGSRVYTYESVWCAYVNVGSRWGGILTGATGRRLQNTCVLKGRFIVRYTVNVEQRVRRK
jgi:hypothetical protein